MGLIEKSMLERWEIAKIEARLDKSKSIKQQKVCCTSNITDYKAQTIDAEPVKHGYWIKTPSPYHVKCSACKTIVCIKFHGVEVNKFCRNCGAKMDLKEGESDG